MNSAMNDTVCSGELFFINFSNLALLLAAAGRTYVICIVVTAAASAARPAPNFCASKNRRKPTDFS
jgi:hypothetical protein